MALSIGVTPQKMLDKLRPCEARDDNADLLVAQARRDGLIPSDAIVARCLKCCAPHVLPPLSKGDRLKKCTTCVAEKINVYAAKLRGGRAEAEDLVAKQIKKNDECVYYDGRDLVTPRKCATLIGPSAMKLLRKKHKDGDFATVEAMRPDLATKLRSMLDPPPPKPDIRLPHEKRKNPGTPTTRKKRTRVQPPPHVLDDFDLDSKGDPAFDDFAASAVDDFSESDAAIDAFLAVDNLYFMPPEVLQKWGDQP